MSEEHKMTKQDKLVLGITLSAIFLGVFVLGLIGLTLGVIAWRKRETKAFYIIGITTSIIAFITSKMFWASIGILGIIGFIF